MKDIPAPRRSRDGQRLPAPPIEQTQRLVLRQLKTQGLFRYSNWQDLERNFNDQAQRAQAASHQSRDVVTGNILHHLPAEIEQLALTVEYFYTQHKITKRPGLCTARTRQAARHATTNCRSRTEMRWLESQRLALFSQRLFQFGEWRPAACCHDKFCRLIGHDAGILPRIEHFTRQRLPVKILAAASTQTQVCPVGRCGLQAIGPARQA